MTNNGNGDLTLVRVEESKVYELATCDYGWLGCLSSIDGPNEISGEEAFSKKYECHYIFMQSRPAKLNTDPEKFVTDFLKFLDTAQGQRFVGRAIVWFEGSSLPEDPAPNSYDEYGIRFIMSNPPVSLNNTIVNNYNLQLGADFSFHIGASVTVEYDATTQSLIFAINNNYNIMGYYEAGAGVQPGLELVGQEGESGGSSVALPLSGYSTGSLVMSIELDLQDSKQYFDLGFNYLMNTLSTIEELSYPFLEPISSDGITVTMSSSLDPLDSLNLNVKEKDINNGLFRTGFVFPNRQSLITSFRTTEGLGVTLFSCGEVDAQLAATPFSGGLVFYATREIQSVFGSNVKAAKYALTPMGDFSLQVEEIDAATGKQRFLCGLFGTEWIEFTTYDSALTDDENDRLRFIINKAAYAPVFPFDLASMTNPDSGGLIERLDSMYQTSWANLITGVADDAFYSAQPKGSPLYLGESVNSNIPLLPPSIPKQALPQSPGECFPVVPYAGLTGVVPEFLPAFESEILGAGRKSIIGRYTKLNVQKARTKRLQALAAGGNVNKVTSKRATTPQGFLVYLADDGITYETAILARSLSDGSAMDFALNNPTADMMTALQTNQLFLVIVNDEPLNDGSDATFDNILDIANWTFKADVGKGVELTNYRNVMILKFCNGCLSDRIANPNKWTDAEDFSLAKGTKAASSSLAYTGLSQWLQIYIQTARDKVKTDNGKELYQNFVNLIDDPNWTGMIVLYADMPLDSLPPQLEGLAAGIDFSRFAAHHFGATVSRTHIENNVLDIKGISTTFGLVDYMDPAYEMAMQQGLDPDQPVMKENSNGYAFSVLQLQVLFKQSSLAIFKSHIQLNVDQLFGSDITATQFKGQSQSINAMVLNGSAVKQNKTTTYVFAQSSPYFFTLDNNFLLNVSANRVQFNTLGTTDDQIVQSRFLLLGSLNFTLLKDGDDVFDITSFGSEDGTAEPGVGLAFSNLQIGMDFPKFTPGDVSFDFVPDNLAFDLGRSTVRSESLFNGLSLQLKQFISAPAGKKPADYDFLPVSPVGIAMKGMSGAWYGISFKVVMGSPGALVSGAGFESDLLIAWSPNSSAESSVPAMFVGLSLPGASPGASVFSLQGVLKLSTGPIKLIYQSAPGSTNDDPKKFFSLQLTDIGLKVLGIAKLPPGVTIQFFLFGDPKGNSSLGWYAAYRKDQSQQVKLQAVDKQLLAAPDSTPEVEDKELVK